ncbi:MULTISPECIES: DUF5793 family protein [unclassified Halorhabdus]|uniref:DUF5793 family protein n=1 Tax=unclassified Halorhabdus TaxID=2621901 RepID=UPI0023DA8A07|nr:MULTISPECIES: DUF5793 family protein [unclassified Halorhabdus]WEL17927.1 Uncharacterized protein SVXHr_1762 [Halorhabdus sp. SVX81]WEL21809.1 Uncharacterized protein HBNXHr_1750 [Halorhabdus sp. BNX81]
MKREHFSLTAIPAGGSPDAPDVPTLRIEYSGVAGLLREKLTDDGGSTLEDEDVDVAFRKREGQRGVLSIAERLTGAFICELDTEVANVTDIVDAAETNDGRYRIEIVIDDDSVRFEKETLLVYDVTGELLRSCSLNPGSVEL